MLTLTKKKDFITIKEFSKETLLDIIATAHTFKKQPPNNILTNKIMGSCFFEPSTRTRLSFESAMYRLGGTVIGFAEAGVTSTKKGETLQDTMKVIEGYVDLIVLRHPLEGAARCVADIVDIPVINAGDGANQHPTQTLLDLFTIQECQGRLEDLNIAVVGDLKFARTVHSLVEALSLFRTRLYIVSSQGLDIPKETIEQLRIHNIKFSYHKDVREVMSKIDILYMSRAQRERFSQGAEYIGATSVFTLEKKHLEEAKDNLRILNPLPRNEEICQDIDDTPFAYYFQQAKNGLYVRQALLTFILKGE